MAAPHPFFPHTRAQMDFRLGPERTPPEPPSPERLRDMTRRLLRAWSRLRPPHLLLLGLASGAVAGAVAGELPDEAALLVSEPDVELARTVAPDWSGPHSRHQVLADASPLAHAMLWPRAGLGVPGSPAPLALVNPELSPDERAGVAPLREAAAALPWLAVAAPDQAAPSLTLAAILHPDEPGLDRFFAQIPAWVEQIAVVWDGRRPHTHPNDPRLADAARPLDDFAAQRNACLDLCAGEWVLFLDGDELLPDWGWEEVRRVLAAPPAEALALPRATLYPDAEHAKVGYGLWPDVQLRLFRRTESVRFERPVHERLTGHQGPAALLRSPAILHESRLRKTPEQLLVKLDRFREAGGPSHMLNPDYPSRPLVELPGSTPAPGGSPEALVLPSKGS